MEKRELFVLVHKEWAACDWLNPDFCGNPYAESIYLYATRAECEKKASELEPDRTIWNDCIIFEGELSEQEILELSGLDEIEDFDEVLSEPYSAVPFHTNFGEAEKAKVASAIIEIAIDGDEVECSNYDFNKSVENAVLVFWSWERYVGYSRECKEIRRGYFWETEELLVEEDKTLVEQCSMVLTADEAEAAGEDLHEVVLERLSDSAWKWTNPIGMEKMVYKL